MNWEIRTRQEAEEMMALICAPLEKYCWCGLLFQPPQHHQDDDLGILELRCSCGYCLEVHYNADLN